MKVLISSPDLVLAVRGQKNRGGGRGRERRKRDLAKYESKRALIGCSIMHAKAPRACLFLSLAVRETRLRRFIELKKHLSRLCLTSTEHDKMYLMFSDTERAVKLGSLIKTLGKIHVSGEDSLSSNCYRTLLNLTITFSEFRGTIKVFVFIIK